MGLRINTNIASLAAQRSLGQTNQTQQRVLGKLSSGTRIVRASDDAAGLAISEKLKAKMRGTKQAERNANDGISLIQTAEGGLNEVSSILIRLRELSIQSASDTVGDAERDFTNKEYQNLKKELERISQVTEFNGKKLLNGEGTKYDFQIGVNNDQFEDRITYQASDINSTLTSLFGGEQAQKLEDELKQELAAIDADEGLSAVEQDLRRAETRDVFAQKIEEEGRAGVEALTVVDKVSSQQSLAAIDNAIQKVSGQRSELGAVQNRLTSVINNLQITNENLSAANSRIRDTEYASETANNTKLGIVSAAGTSVLAQANAQGQAALKLIG